MRQRWVIGCLLVTSLLLLLAPSLLAEEKEIKIGCSVALTGSLASEGNAVKRGVELWADYVNNVLGGIKVGDELYHVKIIFYDDKSDPTTGAKLTEKLITEDKVNFIIGPYASSITFATSAIAEKYGIITIAPAANAPAIYERGFKYIFSILPPAPWLTYPVFEFANTLSPRPQKVAILAVNDLFPVACADGAYEKAKAMGFDVVAYEKYPPGSTDVTPILAILKAQNPDMLVVVNYVKDAIMVVKQMREIDFNVKLLTFTIGVMFPEFIATLGPDAEGICEPEWWVPFIEYHDSIFGSTSAYVQMFKQRYGHVPPYQAVVGSAAGVVLQLAIEKAGSLDTNAVREALLSLDIEELSVFPGIKFDEAGRNIRAKHPLIQVQQGEYKVVWPPLNPPLYPIPKWSER